MTQMNGDTAEAFARALGVTVIEVEDLNRKCMLWDEQQQTLTICKHMCALGRELGFRDILGDI